MDLFKEIIKGNKVALAKGITLLESSLSSDTLLAQKLLENCLPESGNSIRIGITGVPGVGKSTFIESFGKLLTNKGHKVAVLAIDPTSEKTFGSILGDKSRMNQLSVDENAFIRPSPSAGILGGVASKTKDSIVLCEAAGFDIILVETVGVGQSETSVSNICDFFLLLMLAGAGDELQGIKRGIMELADMIVISKAEGDNLQKSKNAKQEYQRALHLFPAMENGWTPKVSVCSALENTGITEIWEVIKEYNSKMNASDWKTGRRERQNIYFLHHTIKEELGNKKYNSLKSEGKLDVLETKLSEGKTIFQIIEEI
ncbi:MAG: methylmalonyl Co-A mutase-associated GTPase MeaB [Flavobacteriales bacterium]|nr:methylmalonyl Co-A mutase-associated GTPase MeaB [Flavobacteriales bacterium]